MDDSALIHLKPRRDPELMGARGPTQVLAGKGVRGYLSAAAKVHGSAKGAGSRDKPSFK